jgi:hypothetical protein
MDRYISRTDAKLRYARIHLEELKALPEPWSADDWQRAHFESFFFHLFGARDAYLLEANEHYGAGLADDQVRLADLLSRLASRGIATPDLNELRTVEEDPATFLRLAATLRHKATHQSGNPLMFYVGSGTDSVRYKDPHVPQNPNNPTPLNETVRETSERLLQQLESLIERLRHLR